MFTRRSSDFLARRRATGARKSGVAIRRSRGLRFGGATAVGGASSRGPAVGSAPPEIAANAAGGWPEHDYDLSNSRADLRTEIDAADVATLKQKWTFKLSYDGGYGAHDLRDYDFQDPPIVTT